MSVCAQISQRGPERCVRGEMFALAIEADGKRTGTPRSFSEIFVGPATAKTRSRNDNSTSRGRRLLRFRIGGAAIGGMGRYGISVIRAAVVRIFATESRSVKSQPSDLRTLRWILIGPPGLRAMAGDPLDPIGSL